MFVPDEPSNPLATLYAAKRDAVLAAIGGTDRRILDIGGGSGRMSVPLSSRHFVVLSDLSPTMLERVSSHAGPRLKLVVADAGSLPFDDGEFDYVLSIDVLPHLPNPGAALAEARRVLRPGGRLIVDSSNAVPLWTLAYPRYLGRNPIRWLRIWMGAGVLPEWQSRVWHYSRGAFVRMVEQAGFTVRSIRGFGPPFCPKWHLVVAEAR